MKRVRVGITTCRDLADGVGRVGANLLGERPGDQQGRCRRSRMRRCRWFRRPRRWRRCQACGPGRRIFRFNRERMERSSSTRYRPVNSSCRSMRRVCRARRSRSPCRLSQTLAISLEPLEVPGAEASPTAATAAAATDRPVAPGAHSDARATPHRVRIDDGAVRAGNARQADRDLGRQGREPVRPRSARIEAGSDLRA